MSYAIPLVYVSDADNRNDAIIEANNFASDNHSVTYVGEPVEFPTPDYEDLELDGPDFVVVVEVR